MKIFKYNIFCLLALLVLTNCQEDDGEFGNITAPSNLVLNYQIVGQDGDNPNGDGTGRIYVTLLNPAGFTTVAAASNNSSMLSDLSVKLQYFSSSTATTMKSTFTLDTASSYYIDTNGAVIAGLQPQMVHAEDL